MFWRLIFIFVAAIFLARSSYTMTKCGHWTSPP